MAEAQTLPDYPRGLDFQQVWAALMENREQLRKNAEQQEKTDRQMKETDRRLGKLGNSFGEVVEYMVAPNLQEKFNDFEYDFQEVSTRHKVRDKKNNIFLKSMFFCKMAILLCWSK